LYCFFSQPNWFQKCCNFSMDWERVTGFSALVTHYLTINLRPFLACHMSKIFLAMRPLQNPETEWGTSPFWQPLDIPFW
jgi:hypothetical protein